MDNLSPQSTFVLCVVVLALFAWLLIYTSKPCRRSHFDATSIPVSNVSVTLVTDYVMDDANYYLYWQGDPTLTYTYQFATKGQSAAGGPVSFTTNGFYAGFPAQSVGGSTATITIISSAGDKTVATVPIQRSSIG